jgi:ferredoxin
MEFCTTCKKCAKNCPSQAIPFGDLTTEGPNISSHSGVLKWYVDCEKCFAWWAEMRLDCTTCIQVCPFNKPEGILHDMARSLIRLKSSPVNHFINAMDTVMGYDRKFPPEAFWDRT